MKLFLTENFYMAGAICVKVCDKGFYGDKDRKCVPCPKNDPTCKGSKFSLLRSIERTLFCCMKTNKHGSNKLLRR